MNVHNAHTLDKFIVKLDEQGRNTFTQPDVVSHFKVDGPTATYMIQDYLRVLAADNLGDRLSKVIYRNPDTRTTNTVWVIGDKNKDVKRMVLQTASDLENRTKLLAGHLDQLGKRNKRAKTEINLALARYSAAHQLLVDALK